MGVPSRWLALGLGGLVIVIAALPLFLSKSRYEEALRAWARTYHLHLSFESTHLSLFPTAEFRVNRLQLASLGPLPVLNLPMAVRAESASLSLNLLALLTGRAETTLWLKNPTVDLSAQGTLEEPTHLPPTPQTPSPISEARPFGIRSIRSSSGTLLLKAGTQVLTHHVRDWVLKQREDGGLHLETRLRLPKTEFPDGRELAYSLNFGIQMEADFPLSPTSTLRIPSARLEFRDLIYQSKRFHLRNPVDPILITLAQLVYSPTSLGDLGTLSLQLENQTFSVKGKIQPNPLLIVAEVEPFSTTLEGFPLGLLQAWIPGAEGALSAESPMAVAFDGVTRTWKFQLDALSLQNVQVPTPWTLWKVNQLNPKGQLHIQMETHEQAAKTKWVDVQFQTPHYTLEGVGSAWTDGASSHFLIKPVEIPCAAIQTELKVLLGAQIDAGTLSIPSALSIQTSLQAGKPQTSLMGRLTFESVSGKWNRWRFQQATGNVSFRGDALHFQAAVDSAASERLPRERNFAPLLLSKLAFKGRREANAQVVVDEATTSIGEGAQLKVTQGVWSPELREIRVQQIAIAHQQMAHFLEWFHPGWVGHLSGSIQLRANAVTLPLEQQKTWRPKWKDLSAEVEAEVSQFSVSAFPLKSRFSSFMDHYLTKFQVLQTSTRELAQEPPARPLEWRVEDQFQTGRLKATVQNSGIVIQDLSLMSPTTQIHLTGNGVKSGTLPGALFELTGTFRHLKPDFLVGQLRRILLEKDETLAIPIQVKGTLLRPNLLFKEAEAFSLYNQRAKYIFPPK
jgi:hypothetical protein